jgi:hypothetical protein
MEVEPACFVADEEGIEEDVFLEDKPIKRRLSYVPSQTAFALNHELLALTHLTITFRVVSRVVKAGWKP